MKKQLQIKREGEELAVIEAGKKLFAISKDNSITGQDLYDFLFKSVQADEKVEIEVTGKDDLQGNDKKVFDRFSELIKKICDAINIGNGQSEPNNSKTDASARLE